MAVRRTRPRPRPRHKVELWFCFGCGWIADERLSACGNCGAAAMMAVTPELVAADLTPTSERYH